MESEIYKAPEAELRKDKVEPLTASERLAQSRKDMEEVSAIEHLNLVWGLRFVVDVLFCVYAVYIIYDSSYPDALSAQIGAIMMLIFFGLEIACIVAYFRRRRWCVIPLHIFAGVSLLNVPFGTVMSIVHYLNMHKIQFEEYS